MLQIGVARVGRVAAGEQVVRADRVRPCAKSVVIVVIAQVDGRSAA